MTAEHFEKSSRLVREKASNTIKKALHDYDVDVIMGPADGRIASVAAAAGFPVATVPLGYADFNGRAFGLNLIAPSDAEGLMIEVMSAWEATFPEGCRPPPMLVDWESAKQTKAGASL